MSMPLTEALEQVVLTPGTYCCHVKGHWVEVRVSEDRAMLAKPFDESDVMLDPWVDLPGVTPLHPCAAQPGIELTVDVPEIPAE